ncbi:MAG: GNAT family N-acetyltransferase [Candidatus Kariarchaeaceae archaeon]|jgi:RimJ/RimL family protein N-acetyltransferase
MKTVLNEIVLREVEQEDLELFFQHQQDPESQHMAAFIHKDPSDRSAFDAHWNKIMNNEEIVIRTILFNNQVVGHIAKFVMFNKPELTYWIGREFWGKGIATQGLKLFLSEVKIRPIFARAAKDNVGSIRVMEKCGFKITSYEKGFANARGEEIEEVVMQLD